MTNQLPNGEITAKTLYKCNHFSLALIAITSGLALIVKDKVAPRLVRVADLERLNLKNAVGIKLSPQRREDAKEKQEFE